MQTSKDREIVCWIAHEGAGGADQVMRRFGICGGWPTPA
jgi:hypothetical protein